MYAFNWFYCCTFLGVVSPLAFTLLEKDICVAVLHTHAHTHTLTKHGCGIRKRRCQRYCNLYYTIGNLHITAAGAGGAEGYEIRVRNPDHCSPRVYCWAYLYVCVCVCVCALFTLRLEHERIIFSSSHSSCVFLLFFFSLTYTIHIT